MENNQEQITQITTLSDSKGKKQKKHVIITVMGVVVVCVAMLTYSLTNRTSVAADTKTVYKETKVTKGNLTVGITESGNTVLGTQTVDYEISSNTSTNSSSSATQNASNQTGMAAGTATTTSTSNTTTSTMPSLVVEEIFAAASDNVKEGDPILKVTDASYTAVKTYLEKAITSAELALEEAKINRTLTKTTAENEYKTNSSQAELAKEAYENTLKRLENDVTNAKNNLSNTKSNISDLETSIKSGYYSDYKIASLKKAVTSAQKSVDTLNEKIATLQEKEQTGDVVAKLNEYKQQLAAAEQQLTAATQSYEQAYQQYESAVEQAKTQLTNLENQLSSLQLAYNEAITNQKKGKLEAKATYEAALVTAQNASTLYDIQLDGIDDAVNSATDTLEEAKEALENFNALVVDGKVLANCTGLVTAIGYEVGDSITSSTPIATVADASEVTITVSVDQEDIASIAVGDQVNVAFSAYTGTTYTGVVTSISTTASSSSSSTITYPVVVTLSGDVSAIYSGMSADVTFVTKEMKDVLYVSNKAIINEGTKYYVKVKATDGTISKVEVTTGFSDGNNVEILSGVSEGDTILIESQVKSN